MREQLEQYVNLLFAGAADAEDIKQEILQNTLDRYDDLVAQGKVPEAAYRLAIAGIGDINEILGTNVPRNVVSHPVTEEDDEDTPTKKLLRAVAVGLYILCPLPLIVLGDMGMDTLGLCGTLAFVAVATVLIMLGAKKDTENKRKAESENEPKSEIAKSVSRVIWATGLGVYFLLSFPTGAWYLTWTIFPVLASLDSLVSAIIQQRETNPYQATQTNQKQIRRNIGKLIWAVGIAVYTIFSFATGGWYISWLLIPITGAVQGLTYAIMDLKEAMEHET